MHQPVSVFDACLDPVTLINSQQEPSLVVELLIITTDSHAGCKIACNGRQVSVTIVPLESIESVLPEVGFLAGNELWFPRVATEGSRFIQSAEILAHSPPSTRRSDTSHEDVCLAKNLYLNMAANGWQLDTRCLYQQWNSIGNIELRLVI